VYLLRLRALLLRGPKRAADATRVKTAGRLVGQHLKKNMHNRYNCQRVKVQTRVGPTRRRSGVCLRAPVSAAAPASGLESCGLRKPDLTLHAAGILSSIANGANGYVMSGPLRISCVPD
jgi:hypothetical protein